MNNGMRLSRKIFRSSPFRNLLEFYKSSFRNNHTQPNDHFFEPCIDISSSNISPILFEYEIS